MKNSVEIMNAKTELRNEIESLRNAGKIEEAHGKLEELKVLNQELEVALMMEAEEANSVQDTGAEVVDAEKVDPLVVFNKRVLDRPLTAAEEKYVANEAGKPGQIEHDPERGGILVPEEVSTQLVEYRRSEVSLKNYCNVVKVRTLSGKFPIAAEQKGLLTEFEELTEINKSQITFSQQSWSVRDFGDIIPVSNTLLQDSAINLFSFIGRQFTKKSVNTENAEILKLLKTMTSAGKVTAAKGVSDIKTTLNTKLDPAIAQNAQIITNQSGFDYLDNLTDTLGRPLISESITEPGKKLISGKELVVLPDELLPNPAKGKVPFYVGDLEQGINFYDRMGVEVARSEHAGFTQNATLLRVIERFDVKPFDSAAVVYVELTLPTGASA